MSRAIECDVCGSLVAGDAKLGCLHFEAVYVITEVDREGDTSSSWSQVELCKTCSDKVLAIIKPALDDFP